MRKTIKVSSVSYLNATPFVYGLKHSEVFKFTQLTLDHPVECARKLMAHEVDIGLIPVAAIKQIPRAKIITDYCIAANGEVASVLLISPVSLDQIQSVVMDHESRTSVLLAKVLAKLYWKINPKWKDEKNVDINNLPQHTACVIIGDRAIALREKYDFQFDLADEWKKFTGLPFVFACWVANSEIDPVYLNLFNTALKFGLDHREEVLKSLPKSNYDLKKYLNQNIQYKFDDAKREGMNKFLMFTNAYN